MTAVHRLAWASTCAALLVLQSGCFMLRGDVELELAPAGCCHGHGCGCGQGEHGPPPLPKPHFHPVPLGPVFGDAGPHPPGPPPLQPQQMQPASTNGAPVYGQPTPADPSLDVVIPPAPGETYDLPPPEELAPPQNSGGQQPMPSRGEQTRARRGTGQANSSIFIPGAALRPRPQVVRLPPPSRRALR